MRSNLKYTLSLPYLLGKVTALDVASYLEHSYHTGSNNLAQKEVKPYQMIYAQVGVAATTELVTEEDDDGNATETFTYNNGAERCERTTVLSFFDDMYQITSTEKHPKETCCFYAKYNIADPAAYDAELKQACTQEAQEGQKLFWDADAADNADGGTCVQSYSAFEFDELVEVKTSSVAASDCCTLGKASDISTSSVMFANSVTASDEPFTNTPADQDNLILACATAITYMCTAFDVGTNCEEITTGPSAGQGESQVDDETGRVTLSDSEADRQKLCDYYIADTTGNADFKAFCKEPTMDTSTEWDNTLKVCYQETITTTFDGSQSPTFSTTIVANSECCSDNDEACELSWDGSQCTRGSTNLDAMTCCYGGWVEPQVDALKAACEESTDHPYFVVETLNFDNDSGECTLDWRYTDPEIDLTRSTARPSQVCCDQADGDADLLKACPITTEVSYSWDDKLGICTETTTQTQNGSPLPDPVEMQSSQEVCCLEGQSDACADASPGQEFSVIGTCCVSQTLTMTENDYFILSSTLQEADIAQCGAVGAYEYEWDNQYMHCTRQLKKDGQALAGAPEERRPRQECCDELDDDQACIRQFTNPDNSDNKSWIDVSYADQDEYEQTFEKLGFDFWMGIHNLGSSGEYRWLDKSIDQVPIIGQTLIWDTNDDFPKEDDEARACVYQEVEQSKHRNDKYCTEELKFSCVMPMIAKTT